MAFELFTLVWIWLAFEWRARCTSPVSPPSSHPFPMQRSECSADANEIIMMLCKHCRRRRRRRRRHRRRPTLRSYCTEEGGRKKGGGRGRGNFCRVAFGRGVSIDGRREGKDGGGEAARRRGTSRYCFRLCWLLSLSLSLPSSESERERERGRVSAFPFRNP